MKVISGKRFCRVLESRGWTLKRIHGSHHIYAKEGSTRARVRVSSMTVTHNASVLTGGSSARRSK